MRGRRDRLVDPHAAHAAVVREDLAIPVAAALARDVDEARRHDQARRQPPAVVGAVPARYPGVKEALRVLQAAGEIDDRTHLLGEEGGAGDATPNAYPNVGAGTGGDASLDALSTDRAGRLVVETGTGCPAASVASPQIVATVAFGAERDDADYWVLISPADPTAAPAALYVDWADVSAVGWYLKTAATLADDSTYHVVYRVEGPDEP